MIRTLIAMGLLIAAGVAYATLDGTFANMSDQEDAGGSFHADFEQQGPHDPGHAYEDVDNDARFTEGKDVKIANPDIRDGLHTVTDPSHGLVIPRSVGTIQPQGPIQLTAGDQGHLIVEVKLEAQGDIQLTAGTEAELTALVAETPGTLDIAAGTTLALRDATLEAEEAITLETTQGAIHAGASTMESNRTIALNAGGMANVDDARLETPGDIRITAGQDIKVKRATLETEASIVLTAGSTSDTIFVEGARLLDDNETAQAAPAGVEIVGTPAEGAIDDTG